MSSDSFQELKARYGKKIETALKKYSDAGLRAAPKKLKEAIGYSLLNPGKRLRPLIVLASAEACGGKIEKALPAACAVEAVHVFSLIHDDLPAMDDDDLRRGRPTNHKVYGEAEAILAGDALLAFSFHLLAEEIEDAEAGMECCRVLAKAAGAAGICGGQSLDLKGSPDINGVHYLKTAVLFEASAWMGGIVGGGSKRQIQALRKFGSLFGSAFQIADDLKDDSKKDQVSYVKKFGKKESLKKAVDLLAEAKRALGFFGKEADFLRMLTSTVTGT